MEISQRNQEIKKLVYDGYHIKEIAETVGLSLGGIRHVVHKNLKIKSSTIKKYRRIKVYRKRCLLCKEYFYHFANKRSRKTFSMCCSNKCNYEAINLLVAKKGNYIKHPGKKFPQKIYKRRKVLRNSGEKKDIPIHRLIMEKHLGRELVPDEIIFFKDGDNTNHNIDNLILTDRKGIFRFNKEQIKEALKLLHQLSAKYPVEELIMTKVKAERLVKKKYQT